MLARKGAKDGTLRNEESDWVTNALRLDELKVSEIMTPRTVTFALNEKMSVNEAFNAHPNIPLQEFLFMMIALIK